MIPELVMSFAQWLCGDNEGSTDNWEAYIPAAVALSRIVDNDPQTTSIKAELAALREQLANATGNYLTLLTEPCIVCDQWKHEREALRERLARVREIAYRLDAGGLGSYEAQELFDELLREVGHD